MNKDKNTLKMNEENYSFIEESITNGEKVQALYQKIGSKWFTFYLVDNELFMSSVDQDEITKEGKKLPHGNS